MRRSTLSRRQLGAVAAILFAAGAFAVVRFAGVGAPGTWSAALAPAEEAPYILPSVMSPGTAWRADAAPIVGPVSRWSSSDPEVICTAGTLWYALRPGAARLTAYGTGGESWSVRVEVRGSGSSVDASTATTLCAFPASHPE